MPLIVLLVSLCCSALTYGQPDYAKTPVFFIHGHGVNGSVWQPLISYLEGADYPGLYLRAVSLEPSNGSNIAAAEQQIALAIDEFLATINAYLALNYPVIPPKTKVDLISHSMGSLSARWYAARLSPERVRKWISLAGASHGTNFACGIEDPGADDMCPAYAVNEQESLIQYGLNGAPFLADVDETPYGIGIDSPGVNAVPPDQERRITYFTIRSEEDQLIVPVESVVLDGAGGTEMVIPQDIPARVTSAGNILMTNGVGHDPMLSDGSTMRLVGMILGLQEDGIFLDDFSRSDGEDLGNGWIKKNPEAFVLSGQAAIKQATGAGYRDNFCYRPASEDVLDVEASVEFRLFNLPPGYPQLYVRLQSDTAQQANVLDGYVLYIYDSAGIAGLGRQRGSEFVTALSEINLYPALNTTDTFRLRLRSVGENPVELAAYVERFDGSGWQIIGQANYLDDSPDRIATGGSVGFGGYVEANYVYDNFRRTIVTAQRASIRLDPNALRFTAQTGGSNPPPQNLSISNGGGGKLVWGAETNAGWLGVTPGSGTGPSTMSISANITGLTAGIYQGFVTVSHPEAENSPQTISVVLEVDDPIPGDFFDDFNRGDGEEIGNGWMQKNGGAFSLLGGAVMKRPVSSGYRDNVCYRPSSEDLLDVEASVEFRLVSLPPGYPQLYVRLQSDTVQEANILDGYVLYIYDDAAFGGLARQRGSDFVAVLSSINLLSALNTTDTFRLRLRTVGTNPVELTAFIERSISAGWQVIGEATALDDSPDRITNTGSVGFGGYVEGNYLYDNFRRIEIKVLI